MTEVTLSPPAALPARRPLVVEGVRGEAFEGAPDELARRALAWGRAGAVEDGTPLASPMTFRSGEHFVKFFPRLSEPPLRRSRARRSGRLHARLWWVPVPPPLLVLGLPGEAPHAGILVTRFVSGRNVLATSEDAEAMLALGEFLGRMHRRGVHHGDLHPGNLLHDGTRWWLLDLESVRGRAHLVLARRLAERQWARLVFNLKHPERLEAPFRRYLEVRGGTIGRGSAERAWAAVRARAVELAEERERRGLALPDPD